MRDNKCSYNKQLLLYQGNWEKDMSAAFVLNLYWLSLWKSNMVRLFWNTFEQTSFYTIWYTKETQHYTAKQVKKCKLRG